MNIPLLLQIVGIFWPRGGRLQSMVMPAGRFGMDGSNRSVASCRRNEWPAPADVMLRHSLMRPACPVLGAIARLPVYIRSIGLAAFAVLAWIGATGASPAAAQNSPPAFDEDAIQAIELEIPENHGRQTFQVDTNVGPPVTAMDPDGDTIYYRAPLKTRQKRVWHGDDHNGAKRDMA